MYGYVLQDWITIRATIPSGSSSVDVIQGESTWMGFSSFQDIVFWLDIREATFPTGGTPSLTWYFETSPSKDNNLFTPMTNCSVQLTSLTPGLQLPSGSLPKVILASGPSVPLATWVRWRLTGIGGTTGITWDATFRVLAAANRVVRGVAA